MLSATMVGAIIAQLTVLGNPIVIFIPGALLERRKAMRAR